MADMLVKLYNLPDPTPNLARLLANGIQIRAAYPSEKQAVSTWVKEHFSEGWAAGCEVALQRIPSSCYIAVEKDASHVPEHAYDLPSERLLGFACYDADIKGMFGPTGVREDYRGRGIGTGLLLASLQAMARENYAYAVIGWVGPVEFYTRTVGATLIEDSEPGIYHGPLSE